MNARRAALGLAIATVTAAIVAWAALRPAPASTGGTAPEVGAATSASAEPSASAKPAAELGPGSSEEAPDAGAEDARAEDAAEASATADPSLARATKTEPGGVHVALDVPVVVTFDKAPPTEKLALTIDPPAQGKLLWRDAQTLAFEPTGWHPGKAHHVRIEGPGVEPVAFQFVSLAPPPKRIEPGNGSRLTLTFDDGAKNPAQVTALLDLLQKEGVQAIFFPTGYWADTHPRLVERMLRDGHRVCNHTYSHQNLRLPTLTEDAIRKEIARGAGAGTCKLFRPPMRATDERVERIVAEMGYMMYLWDVDSRDWEGLPAEDMTNRVLARVRPGSVVLFHMHGAAMLESVTTLIPRLRKAGYVLHDTEDAGAPPEAGSTPADAGR